MVLRPVLPFLRSGVTRTPVVDSPRLTVVSGGSTTPAPSGSLPRANTTEQPATPPANGFAGWISNLYRTHRRPVMGVMAGLAAVPAMTSMAVAQPNTVAPTTTPETNTDTAVAETFDHARLTDYPLFKLFWNSSNPADGTAHEGLDEVTLDGVAALVNYARAHNLDGTPSPAGARAISAAERDLIKAVLENRDYGSFFELDALPKLYQDFGMEANTVHAVASDLAAARATLARILGMNTSEVKLSFPDAGPKKETTYLSMDGKMAEPMRYVDLYREAKGLSKGAEAFEKNPVLAYMMGGEAGHTKHGSFSERSPFSTSGLNWGKLLFPGDAEISELPVKKGFEFPIDALKGFANPVGAYAYQGDRIVPHDKDGNQLTAEKVIQRDASGTAVSWSATFKNASGEEVKAEDVIGLIKTSSGMTKGDGKVDGSMNMD